MRGTIFLLFVCLNAEAQTLVPSTPAIPTRSRVLVAAHRGDWRNEPENSVRAFVGAARMGVDIVELDLNRSKDGEIIIMHDETIDRTTTGKGKPSDYTLEELRRFRLKNGLGRPTQNPIPILREVMTALKGRPVLVNLDKSLPYYREAFTILTETGTLRQAIFKSAATYQELRAQYGGLIDSIVYMPVVDLDKPEARAMIDGYLAHLKPYAFELIFAHDTSTVLTDNRWIREKGVKVWINSLWPSLNAGHDDDKAVEEGNTRDSWDWLIRHGADIIQTDRPGELLQYLKR